MAERLPTGRKYKRGRVWYSAFKYKGEVYRKALDTKDALVAEKRLRKMMAQVRSDILNGKFEARGEEPQASTTGGDVTFSEAWNMFSNSALRKTGSSQTLRQYEFQYGRFQRWMDANYPGTIHIADVSAEAAERFLSDLRKVEQLSSNTRIKYLRLMKYVWRIVAAETKRKHGPLAARLYEDNPWADIPTKGEVQEGRNEFSLATAKKLIEKATDWIRTLFILGLYTGQRLKDCCLLKWEQVDWDANVVILRPHKTRRAKRNGTDSVRLRMHPTLRLHLSELAQALGSPLRGFVHPQVARRYLHDRSSITRDVQAFLVSQGFLTVREAETDPRKRKVVAYGFHSLKHSFVTLCSEAGVPAHVIRQLAGDSYRLYQHVDESGMDAVMKAFSPDEDERACPTCGSGHRGLSSFPTVELEQELARRHAQPSLCVASA